MPRTTDQDKFVRFLLALNEYSNAGDPVPIDAVELATIYNRGLSRGERVTTAAIRKRLQRYAHRPPMGVGLIRRERGGYYLDASVVVTAEDTACVLLATFFLRRRAQRSPKVAELEACLPTIRRARLSEILRTAACLGLVELIPPFEKAAPLPQVDATVAPTKLLHWSLRYIAVVAGEENFHQVLRGAGVFPKLAVTTGRTHRERRARHRSGFEPAVDRTLSLIDQMMYAARLDRG